MNDYLALANSKTIYLIVATILLFVCVFCFTFIVRSYRAGIKMGMEKTLLKKAVTSSATFTAIPSISILLGVLALGGNLGVPLAWLRLSVIGNLQYEATVAQIAAQGIGKTLDSALLSMDDLVTILLVMTVGIIWGCLLTIFTLKQYTKKLSHKSIQNKKTNRPSFAGIAMVAMFIGLCAAFLGNYVANFIVNGVSIPVLTALVSAFVMAIFEYLIKKKNFKVLESFSLALSMIIAMVSTVFFSMVM
jgi:hypothetical protein